MEENKLKEQVRREIEAEAAALEQKINENEELASLEMPAASFADLMARISAAEASEISETTGKSRKSNVKPFRLRKRTLLAVALVAILVAAVGIGATGAKLFVPKVENRGKDGELSISVDSDSEDVLYLKDVTEDEAYEEIEERIGILALRLIDKPKGMELEKVYVDEKSCEALMEFYFEDHILTIYENKIRDEASFNTNPDGEEVDTIETFFLEKTLIISEIDKGNGENYYVTQIETGNAYYYLMSDMELETFKTILNGIIFDAM